MALTLADMEDAIMRARERRAEMTQEIEARWYAPLRNTMTGAMWRGMDAGTREQLRVIAPAAAQAMDKRHGGNNGG